MRQWAERDMAANACSKGQAVKLGGGGGGGGGIAGAAFGVVVHTH